MEITKKVAVLIITLFLISCKNNEYKHIRNDLFEKNKIYFIQQKAVDFENQKDTIVNYCDTIMYNGNIKRLTEVISVDSFRKNKKYYSDKNNVYISNSTPLYFPTINVIKCNNKHVDFLGADYYKIDGKIYFQSFEIKDADSKSFSVSDSTKDGSYYASDNHSIFLKNEIVRKIMN